MADTETQCQFCRLPRERIWVVAETSIAFADAFPVSEGHTLVAPKRHVMILHDLSPDELLDVWVLVAKTRHLLMEKFRPGGFNIGVNEGLVAGQTIGHAHVHIIPRWDGDVPDPRGGIRWVIPGKAKYW